MKNNKQTSKSVATQAAQILKDPSASQTAKRLAGSALSQRDRSNQTGAELEDLASRVLDSSKYNQDTKALAGSVLSHSNKKR